MTDYEDSSLLPPAHLEGTEWHTITPSGFPDAVVFANDGSAIDGTYEAQRYIPEQRYQQLEQRFYQLEKVAKEMINGAILNRDLQWIYKKELEDLGVNVNDI